MLQLLILIPETHLPPSYGISFFEGTDFCVFFLSQLFLTILHSANDLFSLILDNFNAEDQRISCSIRNPSLALVTVYQHETQIIVANIEIILGITRHKFFKHDVSKPCSVSLIG
jgi:hypothetical protein